MSPLKYFNNILENTIQPVHHEAKHEPSVAEKVKAIDAVIILLLILLVDIISQF